MIIRTVAVAGAVAVAKQVHTLEILVGLFEQALAHAGSDVVAVLTFVVYVAQKACPNTLTAEAQASEFGLVQARTNGRRVAKMRNFMLNIS